MRYAMVTRLVHRCFRGVILALPGLASLATPSLAQTSTSRMLEHLDELKANSASRVPPVQRP